MDGHLDAGQGFVLKTPVNRQHRELRRYTPGSGFFVVYPQGRLNKLPSFLRIDALAGKVMVMPALVRIWSLGPTVAATGVGLVTVLTVTTLMFVTTSRSSACPQDAARGTAVVK